MRVIEIPIARFLYKTKEPVLEDSNLNEIKHRGLLPLKYV